MAWTPEELKAVEANGGWNAFVDGNGFIDTVKLASAVKTMKDTAAAQVLPTELTTIEDWANSQLNVKAPEFNPQLATDWQTKLQPITDYKKETMNRNAHDAFATLFAQGGGSTYEANKLANALQGIDAETLAQATAYAQADQNQKYATWAANQDTAKNDLSSIAGFKEASKNFATSSNSADLWNQEKNNMAQYQYAADQRYNMDMWNKTAQLAKDLATKYDNAGNSPWGTSFINNLLGSAAGQLGQQGIKALF